MVIRLAHDEYLDINLTMIGRMIGNMLKEDRLITNFRVITKDRTTSAIILANCEMPEHLLIAKMESYFPHVNYLIA